MAKESPTTKKVLRIGHRGAAGHAPENTLRSIEEASHRFERGVDFDNNLDGICNKADAHITGAPTNTTPADPTKWEDDIIPLDADGGQHVPTLQEALQVANGRVGLILELKASGIGEQVCALVQEAGFTSPVIYASFLHEELLCLREPAPTAATMALFKKLPQDPVASVKNARATHAGLRYDTATKPLVNDLHRAGWQVLVYTVNKPKDIQRVRALGVDGIISDQTELLVRTLG